MGVYKRSEGGITYYTTKEAKSDFKLSAAQKKALPPEVVEQMLALAPKADAGEEVTGIDALGAIKNAIEFVGPKFQQSKEARQTLAVALLDDGADEDAVKDAAGVPWNVLVTWCYGKDDKGKKTDDLFVPKKVVNYIEKQAEKVAAERAANA